MSKPTFILVVLFWARLSNAQPELSISLKGGSSAAVWNREAHNHTYGLSGGLAGDLVWPIGSRFSLGGQLALLYVPRGTESISSMTGEFLGAFRLHYFDVSAALRPQVRVGSFSAYFLLGSSWGILLDAYSETRNVTDLLRRHDVALLAGMGGAFDLPRRGFGPFRLGTVFLEARYDRGLFDIEPAEDSSIKNRTTSIMLGLSFALGSESPARDRAIPTTVTSR